MTAAFATTNGRTAILSTRPDTIDGPLTVGILAEDEYGLRGKHFTGWAIDIGGYIGAVGIGLAVDNPGLHVAIVEPLAENCALIRENIALNGLGDRVQVIEGAAGTDEPTEIIYGYEHVETEPDGYVQASRFVGNIYAKGSHPMTATSCTVPGFSLTALLDRLGITEVALVKLDCEGCEWTVLQDPAVSRVDTFIGEWHGDPGLTGLRELLSATHDVTQIDDNPVNGIFWATRRGRVSVQWVPNEFVSDDDVDPDYLPGGSVDGPFR